MTSSFRDALMAGDLGAISKAVRNGVDVNEHDGSEYGQRPLSLAISVLDDVEVRHAVVHLLLEAGANPKLVDDEHERLGPLFAAALQQDAILIEILLAAGADPNGELGSQGNSLYDWAEFDYRFECYLSRLEPLPEKPTEEDRASEEAWLNFLDRLAITYGKPRPEYLKVLRRGGARTLRELELQARSDA